MINFRRVPDVIFTGAKWYLATLLVFFAALVLVYCVPIDLIQENAIRSEVYNRADSAASVKGDLTTATSPATVQIMLSMAASSDEDVLLAAMSNPYFGEGYSASVESGVGKDSNRTYERYWNGWLVLLKPLLVFVDYGAIKKILLITFIAALVMLSYLIQRKLRYGVLIGIFLGISYLLTGSNIITILPYAFAPLLSIFLSIYVVINYRKGTKRLFLGYFVAGALTTYLDFLITPLMVFAVPTVIYILLCCENETVSGWDLVKRCFSLLVIWSFAYVSLWLTKWIVASLVMGSNVVYEGLQQTLFRVGAEGAIGASNDGTFLTVDEWNNVEIGPLGAISLNLKALAPFIRPRYAVAILVIIVVLVLAVCKKGKRLSAAAVALLAMSPFIWYSIASNHSIIHCHFTFRLLSVTIFALLILCIFCIDWGRLKLGFRRRVCVLRDALDKALPENSLQDKDSGSFLQQESGSHAHDHEAEMRG